MDLNPGPALLLPPSRSSLLLFLPLSRAGSPFPCLTLLLAIWLAIGFQCYFKGASLVLDLTLSGKVGSSSLAERGCLGKGPAG